MSLDQWGVLLGGVALAAMVLWYFFLAPKSRGAATSSAGIQQINILVRGGYEPAIVELRAGQAARLVFDRQDTSGCSEEVLFADLGIRRFLPPLEKTTIELPAQSPGEHEFTCGMGMLRGKLVIR
jgi:plastocyanin domain-containing protein